jgi:nucleotide-binding universal stress UspA family protein
MSAMTRVLLATDGSDGAISAARKALELVGRDAEVSLLTVVDIRPEIAAGTAATGIGVEPLAVPMASPEVTAELGEVLDEHGDEALERTARELQLEGDRLVAHGDAATEICRVAEEGNFDVIVVGSHGRGLVKRVLLGSVSHHVVQHAPCPVLVVPVSDRE